MKLAVSLVTLRCDAGHFDGSGPGGSKICPSSIRYVVDNTQEPSALRRILCALASSQVVWSRSQITARNRLIGIKYDGSKPMAGLLNASAQ
jgi:hypothetical protein